ncbi:hypothetical protein RCL_jg16027.t1 [Rhizophagus clarus]|uniref:Uncharacterized protein n=1 Tax=Rhizophagus clarus TaxID=94130 RepID=A0A8H3L9Y6_9GLOM|nr:hypothetical protein RCL_jg16027.t1 [Rhizophagus clarus]
MEELFFATGESEEQLESWAIGNCAETNPWTHLILWRSDLQLKSCSIHVKERDFIPLCGASNKDYIYLCKEVRRFIHAVLNTCNIDAF